MENKKPALPWVDISTGSRPWQTGGSCKDDDKKILQKVWCAWSETFEH